MTEEATTGDRLAFPGRDVASDEKMAKRRRRTIAVALILGVASGCIAFPSLRQTVDRGAWTDLPPSTNWTTWLVSLCATRTAQSSGEEQYLAENEAAMSKMMNDMATRATGNIDRDFVAMMVPHHQGAIDMAMAVLRHGHNEKIRRLAQEIIVTQQEEIAAMRMAVGESLPRPAASPTGIEPIERTELH